MDLKRLVLPGHLQAVYRAPLALYHSRASGNPTHYLVTVDSAGFIDTASKLFYRHTSVLPSSIQRHDCYGGPQCLPICAYAAAQAPSIIFGSQIPIRLPIL